MIIRNSNIRRSLTDNRYIILAGIIAIILVLMLIRTISKITRENSSNVSNINENTFQSTTYKPEQTQVLGENISETKQENNSEILDKFFKYCNAKDIENAYNLLSNACKEELFNSNIENFKQNYINKIFTNFKTYSMQSWIKGLGDTYKVKITDDMLSTGNTGKTIEDYYTIIRENNEYKLNINSYIGRMEINKEKTVGDLSITVLIRDIYMNYETYRIKVQNNSNKTVLLDTKQKEKSIYVLGSNDVKYSALSFEVDNIYLTITPHLYNTFTMKFNKIYSPNISDQSIIFSDIITDANEYQKELNKTEYTKRIEISVDL